MHQIIFTSLHRDHLAYLVSPLHAYSLSTFLILSYHHVDIDLSVILSCFNVVDTLLFFHFPHAIPIFTVLSKLTGEVTPICSFLAKLALSLYYSKFSILTCLF